MTAHTCDICGYFAGLLIERRARKEHSCYFCVDDIEIGERHVEWTRWESPPRRCKAHFYCWHDDRRRLIGSWDVAEVADMTDLADVIGEEVAS